MRYQSAAAFRTALETRLKEHQSDAVGISRLRKRVVFERLLARLQVVAPDAWVLKGGFALELRLGERARTTKDVDIDWTVREEDAVELLMEAVELDLDDRFEFAIERAALDDPAGGGQRWSVNATLAGREFERVAVDVGFAKEPVLEPETLATSHLLEFADVEPVRVPALAIEQHVAEKLHAYTRTYAGGSSSSRVKDLIDLVVIGKAAPVDAALLRMAINEIFDRRGTHEMPPSLPTPPADWGTTWRRLVKGLPAEPDLASGHVAAARFLGPVLRGEVEVGLWQPEMQDWV